MKISILLITWNKAALLRRCLATIPYGHPAVREVLLVDNGSDDGTATMVREQFPEVRLIRLHRNFGVTLARNVAAANARGDVLFFLDDDGRFHFPSLERVLELLRARPEVAVVGGEVHHFAAEDIGALRMERFVPDNEEAPEVATFKGGCCFIRRDRFLEAGGFPDYFFYGCEEYDLSYRLFRDGYRVLQLNTAVLLHQKEISPGRNRLHFYYSYRNKLCLVWRNLPFGAACRETFTAFFSGLAGSASTGNLGAFLKGYLGGWSRLPRVIRSERRPLTRRRYREYRALAGPGMDLRTRAARLWRDIRFRRGDVKRSRL